MLIFPIILRIMTSCLCCNMITKMPHAYHVTVDPCILQYPHLLAWDSTNEQVKAIMRLLITEEMGVLQQRMETQREKLARQHRHKANPEGSQSQRLLKQTRRRYQAMADLYVKWYVIDFGVAPKSLCAWDDCARSPTATSNEIEIEHILIRIILFRTGSTSMRPCPPCLAKTCPSVPALAICRRKAINGFFHGMLSTLMK
jgi:hypothetical protein